LALATRRAPQYAAAVRELQGSSGGRLQFPEQIKG